MTRLSQPPDLIRVVVNDGTPSQFTWNGQQYRVEHIALHWRQRVWWRGIWRDYFKLVICTGRRALLVVIYRDLHENDWYLQEIYD